MKLALELDYYNYKGTLADPINNDMCWWLVDTLTCALDNWCHRLEIYSTDDLTGVMGDYLGADSMETATLSEMIARIYREDQAQVHFDMTASGFDDHSADIGERLFGKPLDNRERSVTSREVSQDPDA